jgi:SNF2 family DNA or RNA helicase
MLPPLEDSKWKLKLKAGSTMIPVTITKTETRLEFNFSYSKSLMEEIKAMDSSRYHGFDEANPRKIWSVVDSPRNRFQLAYLAFPSSKDERNPYFKYDLPLVQFSTERPLRAHQIEMAAFTLTRRQCILAAEMGTGKTLVMFEVMEQSGAYNWIYVAPKSALQAVQREFRKWKCKITPTWVTYEGLKSLLTNWPKGLPPPEGVCFDESSRLKNKTAQRTQSAQYLADQIREHWGNKGFIVLMSGSPAPKSPIDWWSQCEIACPGFLKEGNPEKFKRRLAIIEQRETFEGGGTYPHLVSWRDDENKCEVCGLLKDSPDHSLPDGVDVFAEEGICHEFKPSINEVLKLYSRMKGLVLVKYKKDCLDLPEKQYRIITVTPSRSILNAAGAINAKSPSTIQALTLLRELSDGFQYVETPSGTEVCPRCHGLKTMIELQDITDPDNPPSREEYGRGCRISYDADGEMIEGKPLTLTEQTLPCETCKATGAITSYTRSSVQIPCPKEDALLELLDEHDDIGRIVIYGGFTGSIERIVSIVSKAQWKFIRVDGRGWHSDIPGSSQDLLDAFQDKRVEYERVAFIGQPGAAGMGLTLTASPTIVYYSNDFNAESRIQSEDRIHRIGMDTNRGATIVDLVHLPSDEIVITNLKKKRKLQDLTMGEMRTAFLELESKLEAERET